MSKKVTIQSKKGGVKSTILHDQWELMLRSGRSRNFIVVEDDKKSQKTPSNVAKADYNQIVKDASAAFKEEKYEEAKDLYEKAKNIKSTTLITAKLDEIEEILSKKE